MSQGNVEKLSGHEEQARQQGDPLSWAIVAPVFDGRRRRNGLWIEVSCVAQEVGQVAFLIHDYLHRAPSEWFFVCDTRGELRKLLPLDVDTDQIVVFPLMDAEERQELAQGILAGVRGSTKELAEVKGFSWHVVTDASGPVDTASGLADGLSDWGQCQGLADLGWEGFLIVGNHRPTQKQPKADQLALTRLLALVTSDADTEDLESLFKSQPRLAFDLLNLVNSPALNLRTPATNFRHAITLLGRRQLKRWLQLLMFTRQTSKGEVNILLWHSAFRGRFMELLAIQLDWPAEITDQAFMVGLFSLLDVLLDDSLENLVRPLLLSEIVFNALTKHQGELGQLLRLAVAVEAREHVLVSSLSAKLHVAVPTLLGIQLESLAWVESLTTPSGV